MASERYTGRTQKAVEEAASMASGGGRVVLFVRGTRQSDEILGRLHSLGGKVFASERIAMFGDGSVTVMSLTSQRVESLRAWDGKVICDHYALETADPATFRALIDRQEWERGRNGE